MTCGYTKRLTALLLGKIYESIVLQNLYKHLQTIHTGLILMLYSMYCKLIKQKS